MVKTLKIGIDVSNHQGDIDWDKAAGAVDFVMIRAGYGKNHLDARLLKNVTGCQAAGLPFGLYWFSYALSAVDAVCEADYVCDLAKAFKPLLPIAFDWEYDSDKYASRWGVNMTKQLRVSIAEAFLQRVKKRGFAPMLYANPDYLRNCGFDQITVPHKLWLAQWGAAKTEYNYTIWQYSSKGKIDGISTDVDMNRMSEDAARELVESQEAGYEHRKLQNFVTELQELYKKYFGSGD